MTDTDAALVERARGLDQAAFAELYERYFDRVYDFLARMVRDRDEAADLAQETFLRAMNSLGSLQKGASFKSWIFTIARNQALNRLERAGRTAPLGGRDDDDDAPGFELADTSALADPAAAAEANELAAIVWEAASALDAKQYSLLDLHVRQGLESAEIAEVLGVTRNNAYVMVNRLKQAVSEAVGALVLFRAGRGRCGELDAILPRLEGTGLNPEARRAIDRHAGSCEACSEQRRKTLPLAAFGGLALVQAPEGAKAHILEGLLQAWPPVGAPATGEGAGDAVGQPGGGTAGNATGNDGSGAAVDSGGSIATGAGHGPAGHGATGAGHERHPRRVRRTAAAVAGGGAVLIAALFGAVAVLSGGGETEVEAGPAAPGGGGPTVAAAAASPSPSPTPSPTPTATGGSATPGSAAAGAPTTPGTALAGSSTTPSPTTAGTATAGGPVGASPTPATPSGAPDTPTEPPIAPNTPTATTVPPTATATPTPTTPTPAPSPEPSEPPVTPTETATPTVTATRTTPPLVTTTPEPTVCVPAISVAPGNVTIVGRSGVATVVVSDASRGCGSAITFTALPGASWLVPSPRTGAVPAGGSVPIVLSINPSQVPSSTQKTTLIVSGGGSSVTVAVTYQGGLTPGGPGGFTTGD